MMFVANVTIDNVDRARIITAATVKMIQKQRRQRYARIADDVEHAGTFRDYVN